MMSGKESVEGAIVNRNRKGMFALRMREMSEIWKLDVATLPSLFTALSLHRPIELNLNLGSRVDHTD